MLLRTRRPQSVLAALLIVGESFALWTDTNSW